MAPSSYAPLNTCGKRAKSRGPRGSSPGASSSVSVEDGTVKTATDDGLGNLTGDATGTVNYTKGVAYVSPNALPATGTMFMLNTTGDTPVTAASVNIFGGFIGDPLISPGTVSMTVAAQFNYSTSYPYADLRIEPAAKTRNIAVTDDGNGHLQFLDDVHGMVQVGTVDYATGEININASDLARPVRTCKGPSIIVGAGQVLQHDSCGTAPPSGDGRGAGDLRIRTVTFAPQSVAVQYIVAAGGAGSVSIQVNQYQTKTILAPNYILRGASFKVGAGNTYAQLVDGTLVKNPDYATGVGTPAGSVASAIGVITVTSWATGAAPTITGWRGLQAPPSDPLTAPFMNSAVMFRTAASPIRPSSMSVQGTLQDGTQFNVTSDVNGKFIGSRVKGKVDYEYGTVQLFFVNELGDPRTRHRPLASRDRGAHHDARGPLPHHDPSLQRRHLQLPAAGCLNPRDRPREASDRWPGADLQCGRFRGPGPHRGRRAPHGDQWPHRELRPDPAFARARPGLLPAPSSRPAIAPTSRRGR